MPVAGTTAYNTAGLVNSLIRSLLNDAGVNGATIGIASVVRAANVVTVVTVGPHFFAASQQVTLAGVLDASFNGTFFVVVNIDSVTFTFAQVAGAASSSGGFATGVNTGAWATDSALLPLVNSAYRKVQRSLSMTGATTFVTDNTLFVVPAVAGVDASLQVVVNEATAPPNQLPIDLIEPVKLWERVNLSADAFIELSDMTESGGLPSRAQGQRLLEWEWRSDGLYFVGALTDIQVRMRYNKAFPDLTDSSSTILIRNAQDAIAYLAAAMAALGRGGTVADKWAAAGDDSLEALIAASTRQQQDVPRRRRPYRSRSGYGQW